MITAIRSATYITAIVLVAVTSALARQDLADGEQGRVAYAHSSDLVVVRDKNEKDERRKAVANADKQSEAEGNPRNGDKVDRRKIPEILEGEKEGRVETNNLPNEALQIEG